MYKNDIIEDLDINGPGEILGGMGIGQGPTSHKAGQTVFKSIWDIRSVSK